MTTATGAVAVALFTLSGDEAVDNRGAPFSVAHAQRMSSAFSESPGLEKTSRDLVIRPRSLRGALRAEFPEDSLWVSVAIAAALVHGLFALAALTDGVVIAILVACAIYALVGSLVAGHALFRRTNRLELRNDLVVRRTLFRRRTVQVTSIVAAKKMHIHYDKASAERAFLIDTNGRAVVRWTDPWWPEDKIHQLLTALQVYFDDFEYLSAYRCNKQWPGSATFYERHFYVTILLSAVVGFICLCLGIAVFAP